MKVTAVIKRNFLTGLVVIAPVLITIWVVWTLFVYIDDAMEPLFLKISGSYFPGVGIVATVLIIWMVGFVASNVLGRKLVQLVEDIFLHLPLLRGIYKTLKQLMDMISPTRQRNFKGVVLVPYPREGLFSLGFVTREITGGPKGSSGEMLSVYVPTNHFYLGDIILFKKSDVLSTDISVEEGIRITLTAGASFPEHFPGKPR